MAALLNGGLLSRGSRCRRLLSVLLLAGLLTGCSVRQLAVNKVGDALAGSGTTFATDDDPELIRDAAPFSLKLMESVLAENPRHKKLLLATSRGFTQYAYAFVQQEADEVEQRDLAQSIRLRERARLLYSRARDYGLRGLTVGRPDFDRTLRENPRKAVSAVTIDDVDLLYWTASSWGALIALSKDHPAVLAEIPIMEAMMDRALELDERFDHGAIHTFMIGYEMVRQRRSGDPAARARAHFARALELSRGTEIAPLVSLAESVCVPQQQRAEFETLLGRALQFEVNRDPGNRLSNLVMQRRARWLLAHADELFVE